MKTKNDLFIFNDLTTHQRKTETIKIGAFSDEQNSPPKISDLCPSAKQSSPARSSVAETSVFEEIRGSRGIGLSI
jgi:hypothetical protein